MSGTSVCHTGELSFREKWGNAVREGPLNMPGGEVRVIGLHELAAKFLAIGPIRHRATFAGQPQRIDTRALLRRNEHALPVVAALCPDTEEVASSSKWRREQNASTITDGEHRSQSRVQLVRDA